MAHCKFRELQKRNRQAYHDWTQAHQRELQQLRVIVSQSMETILSTKSLQKPANRVLTAVKTISHTEQSKSLRRTNDLKFNDQRFKILSKQSMELKARFSTPKWLFGLFRGVEIYESRACAGWNFSIRIYNVVSFKSPILEIAENGDVVGLQQLFSTRQASPFDRSESGWTVLDVRF